jgi:ribosome maturation factor RimP
MWGRFPTFFCSCTWPRRNVSQALEDVIASEVDSLGYELVELRRGGSKSRPVLDVRIDRRDGVSVTVDDCSRASRAIEARLDAEPAIAGDRYVLEVSSPGVERPLRNAADWRRFAGQDASVLSEAVGGRATVEIVAVEGEAGSESVVVRDQRGAERRIPLADVREARLVFHWKR